MKRRDFIAVSGAGLVYTGFNGGLVFGQGRKQKIRWKKTGSSKLFHQLLCDGDPKVRPGTLGLLNTKLTHISGGDQDLYLNPETSTGQLGPLKVELLHTLFNSHLGKGEDLLQGVLNITNGGNKTESLDVAFTTGAQPSEDSLKQKIYIPVSASGLNRDKRLAELGSQDFYQECELDVGEEEFVCHYLEPMASTPGEKETKALMLAPVVDILNPDSPWRMALFTPSDQAYRFSTLKDEEGNVGWSAGRRISILPGETVQLNCFLLCHQGDADRAWEVFHQIGHYNEFAPPQWLSEVKVHYYDFLSSAYGKTGIRGEGYEADIPHFKDFHVGLATQHGYYPYIGDFLSPERKRWQAMQNDPQGPARMSIAKMKDRIAATRATGARAGVYMHTVLFDDASPLFAFMEDSILVNEYGERKKFSWKGPDTVRQNWWMSFASKTWTDHLLKQAEYIMEILDPDAIIFDETFVCLGYENHPDRKGPLSVHSIPFWKEMRRLVHSYGEDKALLTSDCGMSNMVMWADGDAGDHSYATLLGNPLYRKEPIRYKAALGEKPWVPCSWNFLKMWEEQMDLARKMGTAVGVSNGWIEFNGLHGLEKNTRSLLINDISKLY
jgi:hypothetical protein